MVTRPGVEKGNRSSPRMGTPVDEILERARTRINRIAPAELAGLIEQGALVVDIRPEAQRKAEGSLPGAAVLERNVLEWRLDPGCEGHLPAVTGYGRPIVIVCSEGYASSLAAASVLDLGHRSVADLEGGYKAWASLRSSERGPGGVEPGTEDL